MYDVSVATTANNFLILSVTLSKFLLVDFEITIGKS